MSQLEELMMQLDESAQEQTDEDIHAVLAEVPWARKALHTYLISQRPDLQKDVLTLIGELLATPA